jgi:outer membrane lipoprotein SlyB
MPATRSTTTSALKLSCFALLVSAIGLAGCSSSSGPIIDTKGVNMGRYQGDLEDCKTYAEQVRIEEGVVKGAAAGAAVGGATGAVLDRSSASEGAAVGAITGAARSAQLGDKEKDRVVKNCLRGRGYKVLN